MKGRVAFAKIDVEGHESSVLRGMEATLQRTDCLLVECSDLATDSKEPVLKLAAFFDERGFDAYRVGAECLLPLWGRHYHPCLLYTSPSPRDGLLSRMPSSA